MINSKTFQRVKESELEGYYSDRIGLIGPSETEVQKIVLSFSDEKWNYVKTKPWHSSQHVIRRSEGRIEVSYQLKINFELQQKILQGGSGVKVLEPQELKEEIQKELQNTLAHY